MNKRRYVFELLSWLFVYAFILAVAIYFLVVTGPDMSTRAFIASFVLMAPRVLMELSAMLSAFIIGSVVIGQLGQHHKMQR